MYATSSSTQLETDLRADPQDLDALKFVLNTIADICGMGMDIELSYLDTMERYRTLQQYDIPVPADEMAKAQDIASRWQALFIEAKTKDLCLVKVKDQFREVTKQQAVEFHEALKEMETSFKATGPGNSSTELEDGVRLLAEYQDKVQASASAYSLGPPIQLTTHVHGPCVDKRVEIDRTCQGFTKLTTKSAEAYNTHGYVLFLVSSHDGHRRNIVMHSQRPHRLCAVKMLLCIAGRQQPQVCMSRKLELVNAEGLFGLDTTEYPELQRVVSEMKKLGRIYDLYQEQREFEEGNSATPWGDLDVGSLQRGVEVLEKKARKEKQFKEHPTFRAVEGRIFNFKDSIPLIVNLKNEAMKPRHWQKLMEASRVIPLATARCVA